jgi:hypothetical protein
MVFGCNGVSEGRKHAETDTDVLLAPAMTNALCQQRLRQNCHVIYGFHRLNSTTYHFHTLCDT